MLGQATLTFALGVVEDYGGGGDDEEDEEDGEDGFEGYGEGHLMVIDFGFGLLGLG